MPEREAGQSAPPLAITLFGRFKVRQGDLTHSSLRSQKSQELLALLALHLRRDVDRSWLAGTLWPETTDSLALFYLRRTLVQLRHCLADRAHHLSTPRPDHVRLDLTEQSWNCTGSPGRSGGRAPLFRGSAHPLPLRR